MICAYPTSMAGKFQDTDVSRTAVGVFKTRYLGFHLPEATFFCCLSQLSIHFDWFCCYISQLPSCKQTKIDVENPAWMEIINSEGILPKWFSTCVCRFTPEYSNPQKDRTGWSIVDIVDAICHNLPHISRCPTFLSISGLLQSPWLSARIILGLLYLHRKEVAWPNRGTVALWHCGHHQCLDLLSGTLKNAVLPNWLL